MECFSGRIEYTCKDCGGVFEAKKGIKKVCPSCRVAKTKATFASHAKEVICKGCGNVFIPAVATQKYCTKRCWAKDKGVNSPSKFNRFIVFARDSFRCVYCGKSALYHKAWLHIEHIVPRDHGGDNSYYNVVAACDKCNTAKCCFQPPLDTILELWERNIKFGFDEDSLKGGIVKGFNETYIIEYLFKIEEYYSTTIPQEERYRIMKKLIEINPNIFNADNCITKQDWNNFRRE